MKTLKIVGAVFFGIGICLLIAVGFLYSNTMNFLSSSEEVIGEIISVSTRSSRDSDGYETISRYPVIRFEDMEGQVIEFESSTSKLAIALNEKVEVRYEPGNPTNATLAESFIDIWLVHIILGGIGTVFSMLGGILFYVGNAEKRNRKKLTIYTRVVEAKVNRVYLNKSVQVNGRSLYFIEAQWLDNVTNKMMVYKSTGIWMDPKEFIGETIKVNLHPSDPKKYVIDTSFLPEVG